MRSKTQNMLAFLEKHLVIEGDLEALELPRVAHKAVVIDCSPNLTEYKALVEIAKKLGLSLPSKGLSPSLLRDLIMETIKEPIMLILREADQLEDVVLNRIVYFFSRANIKLVLLVRRPIQDRLSARVKSSFQPHIFRLKINEQEFKALLEKKASELSINLGDVLPSLLKMEPKQALELLEVISEIAPAHKAITKRDLEKAREELRKKKIRSRMEELSEHQRLLFKAIINLSKSHKRIYSGDVYKRYEKLCLRRNLKPYSNRTLLKWLNLFEDYGFIECKKYYGGRMGKRREIKTLF